MSLSIPASAPGDIGDAFFQALFDSAGLAMAVTDLEGRLIRVNQATLDLFGYTEEEMVGRQAFEFTHPEDREKDRGNFHEIVQGNRQTHELDLRHVTKNGRIFWGHLSVSLVRGPDGAPLYTVGIIQDLTTRHEAELALRISERRYEQAAVAGRVGVWDLNLVTGELYLAPNLKALLGYGDDLPNTLEAWCELVHPEDKARVIAATQDHLEGKTPVYEAEMRRRHRNGHYLWFLARGTAERDAEGRPFRLTGSDTDVTHRRLAEQQIRESEERLRLALDAGECGTWDWDIRNNTIHWSERVFLIHGVEPGAFSGQIEEYTRLVHPDDSHRVGLAISSALQLGTDYQIEFRIVRPNGEVRWISTSGRVLRDEQGPYRMLGATIDTTDRVLGEQALREAVEELAIARDQALEASRAKTRFLANMSHELRTPLNAIIGYAEMIVEANDSGPTAEIDLRDMERIRDSGLHLLSMINEVLDLSKIDAGKMGVTAASFPLVSAVEWAVSAVRPLAKATSNSLIVHVGQAPETMRSDETKIRQILINLLSNACKFTEHGTVTLTVRAAQLAEQSVVEFIVADTGIGIACGDIPKLFQEFVQLDTSPTRRYDGTGLGLAISKRFCEMLGGTLDVESRLGQGSTFTVRLPLEAGDQSRS